MRRPPRRPTLSTRDLTVIDIERRWGPGPSAQGMKLDEAQRLLGLDAGAYAFVLNSLIDDPAALAHDPDTLGRLRSIRDQHRSSRTGVQTGAGMDDPFQDGTGRPWRDRGAR